MDSSNSTLRTGLFPIKRVPGLLIHICIHVCNANSVDPEQTPRPAASDLDLHCLLMSLLEVSRDLCLDRKTCSDTFANLIWKGSYDFPEFWTTVV